MRKVLSIVVAVVFSGNLVAAPTITATSGTAGTGNSLTISGTGFGTKSRSKPYVWADFQESSLDPHSTLSTVTSWTAQLRELDTSATRRWGIATSKSTAQWGADVASRGTTFRADLSGIGAGSKILISFWRRSTVDFYPSGTSENFKLLRIWDSDSYPNVWLGIGTGQTSSDMRWSVENMTPVTSETVAYFGSTWPVPDTTWRHERFFIKMNSATGVLDGAIYAYLNNTLTDSDTTFKYNTATVTGWPSTVYIQNVSANYSVASGEDEWFDSIFIDDSWNAVYVGNASTLAACTQLETQPYTAWSSNSVTINQRLGTLSGSKYIYICDTNNDCNSTGFLLSSGGDPGPTITSIDPANGPAAGGTTVTINGTGFTSTPSVKFGGVDATSETYIGSTQITCVTPAGTADTSVDVLVINPDTQNYTLSNGFTYDPEQATIDPVAEAFPWISEN